MIGFFSTATICFFMIVITMLIHYFVGEAPLTILLTLILIACCLGGILWGMGPD